MHEADPQNVAFTWSTLFVRTLFEQGIEHAIISPGSRSTALTLAFAAHPGFKKHVIIDERSAAFTALGLAKASGLPAVLVCTSGTAVANYFPAVIEARQSGVSMIIASADRPPKFRGLGASQTIDQLNIFGNYPVFFHEAGEPDSSKSGRKRLQHAAIQAVDAAISKEGVSHLNFPFSKPFEPEKNYLQQIEQENEKHSERIFSGYEAEQGKQILDETFWSDLVSAEKPLIIAGPASFADNISFIEELSVILKAPVLAEPGSNIAKSKNQIEGFDGFLNNQNNWETLTPDLILRFGQQPVSKSLNTFLTEVDTAMQISFMNPNRWIDGSLSSDKQVKLNSKIEIPEITGSSDSKWLKSWKKTERTFKSYRKKKLEATRPLTDGFVFSEITPALPTSAFSMLSNSFPVRDMSLFGKFTGKEIYLNRGAAGIDGINSTAIGLSISHQKTGVLLVGDIAFLHDSNALLNAGLIEKSLIIIVLNNGGGTIFRMLPVHSIKHSFETYFETPQHVSISALCRAHKIEHTLVSKPNQLLKAFKDQIHEKGLHVIECMTDADASMELRHELWNFSLGDTE